MSKHNDKFNETLNIIENLISECQNEDAIINLHRARLDVMKAWDNEGINNK